MIRSVIFDIDSTLYDYDSANVSALAALSSYTENAFGWQPGQMQEENRRMMRILAQEMGSTAGSHNRLIRYQRILEEKGIPLSPHVLRMYRLYWETLMEKAALFDGAEDTLRTIHGRGIRIGIGTDMTSVMQVEKLERFGLMRYIDYFVSSEEAGAEKPDRRLFDLCVRKSGCRAEECLFVGDNYRKDYCGAVQAGLEAALFLADGDDEKAAGFEKQGVRVIRALREVTGLL